MGDVIADKSKDNLIIHPITLHNINNEQNKYLTMPVGKTNIISEQSFFTDIQQPINTNHEELFFSHEYYFKIVFNADDFDSCLASIYNIMDSDCDPETASFLISRFLKMFTTLNDKKLHDMIELNIKYYSRFENKNYNYSEMSELIKNKFSINK
jgi:hypothetical protein